MIADSHGATSVAVRERAILALLSEKTIGKRKRLYRLEQRVSHREPLFDLLGYARAR